MGLGDTSCKGFQHKINAWRWVGKWIDTIFFKLKIFLSSGLLCNRLDSDGSNDSLSLESKRVSKVTREVGVLSHCDVGVMTMVVVDTEGVEFSIILNLYYNYH